MTKVVMLYLLVVNSQGDIAVKMFREESITKCQVSGQLMSANPAPNVDYVVRWSCGTVTEVEV